MKKTVRNIVILLAVLLVLGGTAYLLMNLPKDGDGEESSQVLRCTLNVIES